VIVAKVDWTALGSIAAVIAAAATVAGVVVSRRRAGERPDAGSGTGGGGTSGPGEATRARFGDLSDKLAEYMKLSYNMDLEQKSEAGRRKEFTPDYYRLATREDDLRNRILLLLDPSDPEQARLLDAFEGLLRCADPDVAWIDRRDKLLHVAREVTTAQREGASGV
jgi:hypothetical protein